MLNRKSLRLMAPFTYNFEIGVIEGEGGVLNHHKTEFLKELFLFKHNFTRIRFDVSWFKFLNHDNKMMRLVKMCVQLKLTIIDI